LQVFIPCSLACFSLGADTFPEGRFRRFVIRFCGFTYNTVNHLKIILFKNPYIQGRTIAEKIFSMLIIWKQVPNKDWFLKIPFLGREDGTCANQAIAAKVLGTLLVS
jgi:hypothetical protein